MDWERYVGITYKRYGRDKSGYDCWGLCRMVYSEMLGVELPDLSDEYFGSNRNERNSSINECYKKQRVGWTRVEDGGVKEFDIVAFGLHGIVNHIGVAVSGSQVLHIEDNAGSVIQRIDSLKHRICGVYRYTGANPE